MADKLVPTSLLCKMSQSEDEAVGEETEWRCSLVDSLSVGPGATTTGKVEAKAAKP